MSEVERLDLCCHDSYNDADTSVFPIDVAGRKRIRDTSPKTGAT